MSGRRCIRLVVPVELHESPASRAQPYAGDLLVSDWKLRGSWRREITDDTPPAHGVQSAGAA